MGDIPAADSRDNRHLGGPLEQVTSLNTINPISSDLPLAVSIRHCCELTSLGKTSVARMIRDGELEVTRLGRRTLVHMSSIRALLGIGNV